MCPPWGGMCPPPVRLDLESVPVHRGCIGLVRDVMHEEGLSACRCPAVPTGLRCRRGRYYAQGVHQLQSSRPLERDQICRG